MGIHQRRLGMQQNYSLVIELRLQSTKLYIFKAHFAVRKTVTFCLAEWQQSILILQSLQKKYMEAAIQEKNKCMVTGKLR